MQPRTVNELASDPIMDDMLIKWNTFCVEGEVLLLIATPATKRHVWMYNHISDVVKYFIESRMDYYKRFTPHRTKIDIIQVVHKDLKKQLRKMHKFYPVEFGYALKAPCDMHSVEFSKRVALERLILKIKGAV